MSALRAGASLALAATLLAAPARANEDGRQTGRAMRGCGTSSTCHGVNPGATARIEGPMTLAPGARGTYTLVIGSSRTDFRTGGFDIAASGASLAVNGTTSRLVGAELTHAAPVPKTGAEVRVAFDVVAPATPGAAMLFATGNATDGMRNQTNDAWALAMLAVTVGTPGTDAGAPVDAGARPDAGARVDAGRVNDSGLEAYDPTASMAYGGCSASPRGRRGAWVALALVAIAALRRRAR